MTPTDQALTIVRAGLHDIRVQLGETTDEHETYQPRHPHH